MKTRRQPLINTGWIRAAVLIIVLILLYSLSGLILTITEFTAAIDLEKSDMADSGSYGLYLTLFVSGIISILAVIVCRKIIDREPVKSLGLEFILHRADAFTGLCLAIVLLGTGSLILVLNNNLQWIDIYFEPAHFFISFLLMVMIAFSEELVFRGYILSNLLLSFNKWIALAISAVVFTIFHLQNPGINVLPVINLLVAGVLLGINYIYTRNLWFSIMFHFTWNFFQGPVLGYRVSGLEPESLLVHEIKGNELLTGGSFGFEGSLLQTILSVIVILILFMIYESRSMKQTGSGGLSFIRHQ